MSNSLADQLLKAGVVSEEDVARSEKQKKQGKKRPNKPKQKKKAPQTVNSREVANSAARKAVEAGKKATQKDAEKKQQQEDAEKRRLLNIKILDALKDVPVEDPEGEEKFNYLYQNKVRGIYISASQKEKLVSGELAITVLKAKTKLIPMSMVEKLKAIDPDRFIFTAEESKDTQQEDGYEEHQIPDDLMW